jgi:hypothetical protein
VDSRPTAASCALDGTGLGVQRERYRRSGLGAHLLERTSRRLSVDLADGVDLALVDEALAIERDCCPFFELDWQPASRRLTVSVAAAEHEPALEAIASALGLGELGDDHR